MKSIDQEKTLKTMIELAHDGIVLLDSHGIIIQANPAALPICGFKSADDIRRQPVTFTDLFDLYDQNDTKIPLEKQPVSRALNGESIIDFNSKGIRKDTGNKGYWLFSAVPIFSETKKITVVVLSIKDISGFIQSTREEESLLDNEAFYRSLFDNMLNGIAYCRMLFENGIPRDFIYLNVNSAFESLTGLRNVAGKKVSEVIPGIRETDFELFEYYGRVALTGKPERFERYLKALKMWFSISVYSPKREFFVAVFEVITERKQSENKLQKSEAFLNSIIDQSPNPMWISDDSGTLKRINRACLNMLNMSEDEVIGKYNIFKDNIVEEQGFMPLVKDVFEKGDVARFELVWNSAELEHIVLKKYAFVILDVSIFPIRNENGEITNAVIQHINITERKRVEESLRESERKARAIFDISLGFLGLLTPEGILLDANRSALEFIDAGLSDVKGKPFWETPWWTHSQEAQKQIKDAITTAAQGKLVRMETTHSAKDGSLHFVDFSLKPMFDENHRVVLLIPQGRDITKRKQAEIRLLERNRFVESIVNMTPDILYIYDIIDNKNIYINDSIEKILGYSKEEIRSMGNQMISSLMHPDDFVEYQKTILPKYTHAKDKEQIIHEYRMKRKSGGWCRLSSNETIYLRQSNGSPRQVFGLVRDITESKAAEEALRESEYFFKESQIAANIGSYKLDFTTGYWKSSEVLDRIFGINQDYDKNIQGWLDIIHPDDRTMMDNYLQEVVASKHQPFRKEYKVIRKSDSVMRWVDGSGRLVFDNNGALVSMLGTIQDITERKRAEEALRQSEEKFSKAFMTSPDSITITRLTDGVFIEINAGSMEMYGYTREEMIGHSPLPDDLNIWVNKEERDRMLTALKATGEVKGFESLFRRKDGSIINGLLSARIIKMNEEDYILATIRDITEQKKAEEALKQSEEKFSKAFMTSPDSITITRLSDGILLEINNGCIKIFGYTREEMIGHTPLPGDLNIWVNKEDRDRMVATLKIKGELNAFDALFRRKDGSILYGIVSARIIKMNETDYLLATIHDVTKRKKAEEALKQSEEKFSKAFMTSPDSITITRLADGVFIEVNNGIMEMFGYTREEMIGHSALPGDLNIWVDKDDRERFVTILKATGEVKNFEVRCRCKDGKIRYGMLYARIIRMNGEDYIITTSRDVTEQKKAEEIRNRLTRELRALSSCNQALIRAENEQTLLDDICRIVCDIAGYKMAWAGYLVDGESPYVKVVAHAGSGASFLADEVFALSYNGETPIDIVIRNKKSSITPDFSGVPAGSLWSEYAQKNGCRSAIALPILNETGNSLGVLSIYSGESNVFADKEIKLLEELAGDLSFGIMSLRTRVERRHAQNALVYEKELSDALIEASPAIFCVMDRSGRIFRMNTNLMKLYDLTGETFTPQDAFKFVYREDYDLAKQDIEQLPDLGQVEDDIRFEFKNGEISWWRFSAHAVTIAGVVYIIAAGLDITSRKQMEENLQTALKEKEVLLQELYHRTKNNMQVISSYLAMQALNLDDENLQTIFSEMENRIRAMALVHEKLYKSKDLTNINLRDYLSDLTKLIFNSFPASDKVTLTFEIEDISVTMDIAIPVGLVVTELLTNSLKYAFPEGRTGKIDLRVQKHDVNEIKLNIKDNGVGVPGTFDFTQKGSIGIPTVFTIVQKQLRGSAVLDTSGGFDWKIIFRSDLYSKRV